MASADASAAAPLAPGLRINLSVMMFFQFAVWGAWFSVLGNYLGAVGLGDYTGTIFGTMALGTIFAPLIVGQIADRYFASEKLMALCHLAGAGLLYVLATLPSVENSAKFAKVRDAAVKSLADFDKAGTADAAMKAELTAAVDKANSDLKKPAEDAAWQFWTVALVYALLYSPTLALSNSIAFTHIPDATRDFPSIRVLGTIGWIAAGMAVGKVLTLFVADPKVTNVPLLLAAALSAVLGVLSFFLPHTPPKGKAGDALPFLKAVGLLKDPNFAVFFGVSFIITIVLAFYYNFTGMYLEKHQNVQDVASTMTLGQWSEMLLLPLLPLFLQRLGMKTVLAIGMLAWGLRYGVFAWGGTLPAGDLMWIVIASLAFHGICYDFFFAAGFIHVDNESPADIRGSAQALFTFLTYGLGMWIGSEFSGRVFTWCKTPTGGIDWATFWAVPSIGVLIAFVIFVVAFGGAKKTA